MTGIRILSRFVAACLTAAFVLPPAIAQATTADYSRTPILMIHGYFVWADAGTTTWTSFKNRLIEDGWPEEYISTPSFADVRGCNEAHVGEIDAWVDDLLSRTGFDKVDIVCHSFGCLNTLTWLKERCGMNRVRQYVGLAGAVHGTMIACADAVLSISCAGKEMCVGVGEDAWKDNELIVDANACDETPGNVQYTSVWSEYDEIIRPPEGSIMAGARNIEVATKYVEHGGIFLCDECYEHLKTALTEGGWNEDGPSWTCTPECTPPEVADPPPETTPESADAAEAVEADAAVGSDPASGEGSVTPDTPPDDAGTPDPGSAADLAPDRAAGTDGTGAEAGAADLPATDADGGEPKARRGSGCAAGTPGAALPTLLAMLLLAVPIARRRCRS